MASNKFYILKLYLKEAFVMKEGNTFCRGPIILK